MSYDQSIVELWREINELKATLGNLKGSQETGHLASCRVFGSGAKSLTNNTFTTLQFDSERWDTDDMHSTVSNTDKIYLNSLGYYMVGLHLTFSANATGQRYGRIYHSGTGSIGLAAYQLQSAVSSGWQTAISVVTQVECTVEGQYVYAAAYQNSGGPLNLEQGTGNPAAQDFWAYKLI